MKAAAILACFLAAGCATQNGYVKVCESWFNHHVSELVNEWGPPVNTFNAGDGTSWYTWSSVGGIHGYQIPNTPFFTAQQSYCNTSFLISTYGLVKAYRFQGNCRA